MAKQNFYCRLPIAETEGENVEIYIGKSSGKQLQNYIENANEEVLIVSPYIDASKLKILQNIERRGVRVRLAFSSLMDGQKDTILQSLIEQNRHTDELKKSKMIKNLRRHKYLSYLFIALFCLLPFLFFSKQYLIIVEFSALLSVFYLVCGYVFFKLFSKKKLKIKSTHIYSYSYTPKLDFKYLRNSGDKEMFIHSKIYIIDRKTAFLGSTNFTNKGFTTNFETRVRISHKEEIKELVGFVNSIFDDDYNFNGHELYWLGPQVYKEQRHM